MRELVQSGKAAVTVRDVSNHRIDLVWERPVTFASAARLVELAQQRDASFETATSARIQTLMLFHRYDIVTHSIGFVFYHERINDSSGV